MVPTGGSVADGAEAAAPASGVTTSGLGASGAFAGAFPGEFAGATSGEGVPEG